MNTDRATTARWPRRVLLVLSALNTFGAAAGAWGLASGVLDLGSTITARLPWGSAVAGGVALGVLVALPNLALLVGAVRDLPFLGTAGTAVGTGMVVWILVQLAFIRDVTFFHPLYVGVGLAMVWAGLEAAPTLAKPGQHAGR